MSIIMQTATAAVGVVC